GRVNDLYNDRTIPLFTEALAGVLGDVHASPDAQASLARLDARQGYRPGPLEAGVARPLLSYPRLDTFANALLRAVATDSDPLNLDAKIDKTKLALTDNRRLIPGPASGAFQDLLAVSREELRSSTPSPPLQALGSLTDTSARTLLSRPRSNIELTKAIFLAQDGVFGAPGSRYIVQRDPRGVAAVGLVAGSVPGPFVDLTGPSGKPDGLPDLDPLGQFVSQAPLASPFFSVDGVDGQRDALGRATTTGGGTLYGYVDANRTYVAQLTRDLLPLIDAPRKHEGVMNLAAGIPVLAGNYDAMPTSKRTYPADPSRVGDWKLAHAASPPANLGTSPVELSYRAYHPETSPMIDLVYAVGQLLANPSNVDVLTLLTTLIEKNPGELARLVGVGLKIKAIADGHPEAHIPAGSTLWDELFDTLAKIAKEPGLLEAMLTAFGQDATVTLTNSATKYLEDRDELTYDRNNLNGPVFNLTTGGVTSLVTPVDRSAPDTGSNRSAFQRFLQILHETNGLAACTKDGAIAHVVWKGIKIDYPTDFVSDAACLLLTGHTAPSRLPQCGVLRIENVAAMLLDVALGRANFDIRDQCLSALANSPLTGIVGGTDAFLEQISGVNGFSTHPTVNGISRLVFFDTPHDGLAGDVKNPQSLRFFWDIIDPVPSTVCPLVPFTDTDGKVLNLRKCASFKDTLCGRDGNATFPLEELGFIKAVQPLAAAFADHNQSLLFVELFDTLHLHWGSKDQSLDECDPSGTRSTNGRWCSQDGTVTYEPLIVDALRTDLFPTLHDMVALLQSTTVTHCSTVDPATHACTKSTQVNGIQVLAEGIRGIVDPARAAGLTDRHGNAFATRNDGNHNPQTTPIYLLTDALNRMDGAFTTYAATHPADADRLGKWRSARSDLTDSFFSVEGAGAASRFSNAAVTKVLPLVISVVKAQLLAHCPDPAQPCTWAKTDLTKNASDVVGGPTFAAIVNLLDAVRKDDGARTELEQLVAYLLDPSSPGDASATTTAAIVDLLQTLEDDQNLSPVYRAIANVAGGTLVADDGHVVKRSVADAAIETLARIFAHGKEADGRDACGREIDPQGTLKVVLARLIQPMGDRQQTPFDVVIDVVADVNRAHPELTNKLDGADYANITLEVSDFCLNRSRGLEQVYDVIRKATAP
ncbi:MAG: hypothetical protein ABIP39_01305, partial [Polyangiaceae bacterium]